MGLFPTKVPILWLSTIAERMAKAALTSQSDFEELLRNIDKHTANVDHHAGLVDAERKFKLSRSEDC